MSLILSPFLYPSTHLLLLVPLFPSFLLALLQEPYGPPVGTYADHFPVGGGQPPQLPTCPPTYESVSN